MNIWLELTQLDEIKAAVAKIVLAKGEKLTFDHQPNFEMPGTICIFTLEYAGYKASHRVLKEDIYGIGITCFLDVLILGLRQQIVNHP